MESYKQEKIIIIMYEYLNDKREFYPISNVPLDKAKFFYKDDDGLFKLMAVSDYTVKTELNENRLYIVNAAIKDNSEKFQIGYEINFKAAEYESPLPVLSVLTKMYNQLIEDTRILHSYIRKQCFVADGKEQALVLPGLPAHTVWCMGENGKMFALPVSELYSKFQGMINTLHEAIKKLLAIDYGNLSNDLRKELDKHIATLELELKKQLEILKEWGQGLPKRVDNLERNKLDKVNTIAELQSRKNLKVGDIVEVLGYYEAGDGAGHKRIIANEDDGSGVQLTNGLWANIVHNGEVNVSWFGAKGDGVTDDTVNIKKAINYLKENNTLYFQQKTYLISCSANNVPMFEITKNNIVIKGSRATLKLINNHYTHYTFFKIYNANNVKICGLIIQGDRLEHDYKTMSGTHEFGYGIFIIGDNPAKPVNCIIENCYIYDMTGDAIVTKNGLSKGTIEINDCKIRKCRRQGISVLDSDVVIINNTDIQRIGTWDGIEGTAPMSCIDIEPASGTKRVELVVIKNSILKYAINYSLVGFPKNFKMFNTELCDMTFSSVGNELFQSYIDSCVFTYDENKKNIYTSFPDIELINCTFDYSKSKIAFADFGQHQTMYNCLIKGGLKSDGKRNVIVRLQDYGDGKKAIYNNCTFDGVEIKAQVSSDSKFNNFKNCLFTMYSSPNIISSTFENCENNPIYNFAYNFYNCVIDRKFYPDNSVLNNTTVIEQPISLKLEKLSETYFAEKMKQENVYDDYIAYMDEKTLYDKKQRKLEQEKQLAYQEALKENPDLTFEEFLSLQTMTLNLTFEPEPSQALQEFIEKYL